MKEKIEEMLQELGFLLEDVHEFGYAFKYESLNMLWIPNDKDEDFLVLSVPAIADVDDMDEDVLYKALNTINAKLKYIKAYIMGDRSLWLFYERELLGNEDLEEMLTRMILRLAAGTAMSRKILEGQDDTDNTNDDDCEDGTDEDVANDDDDLLDWDDASEDCDIEDAEVIDEADDADDDSKDEDKK